MIYTYRAQKTLKNGYVHKVNNNVDSDSPEEARQMANRQLKRLYGTGYKLLDVTPND